MTSIAIQRSVKTGFGLAVAAAVVAICGCAAGSGTLSGKVTFKGKTVASGNVLVVGADGIARSSKIETDGSYTVPDVPVGEAKISVNSPNPVPDPVVVAAANTGAKRGGRSQQNPITSTPTSDPKLWFPLPEQYADPQTSGLTAKVQKGQTVHNIDLP
jgi:hypothetical protein